MAIESQKKRHPRFTFKKEPKHVILKVWWDYPGGRWIYRYYRGQGIRGWARLFSRDLILDLEYEFANGPSGSAMIGWATRRRSSKRRSDNAKRGWETRRTRSSGRKRSKL